MTTDPNENKIPIEGTITVLSPVSADARIHHPKRSQLDRLYQRVVDDLDALVQATGLKAA